MIIITILENRSDQDFPNEPLIEQFILVTF